MAMYEHVVQEYDKNSDNVTVGTSSFLFNDISKTINLTKFKQEENGINFT